jgi:hypothetical protein
VAVAVAVLQAQAVQVAAVTVQRQVLGLTVLQILAVVAAVQKVRLLELARQAVAA